MGPSCLFPPFRPNRAFICLPRLFSRAFSQRTATNVAELLARQPEKVEKGVTVNGYVRSIRSMKSCRFIALGDGSTLASLQAILPIELSEDLDIGAAVRLQGDWVSSPGTNQSHELHVGELNVLGPSDAKTFPLQKKYQTPEFLRTLPHLRPRTPFNAALLRLRSAAIASITHFFSSHEFTQTHPPVLTSSDCEGAGEVFTVSKAASASPSTPQEEAELYFRSPKYLTVSSQLHLEALAQAVGNVWALTPTFRAEESDTSRHLSEFYMLETEISFVDGLDSIMNLTEELLRHLASTLYNSKVVEDILTRNAHIGTDLVPMDEVRDRWIGLMKSSWPRLTYTEAIKILNAKSDQFVHRPAWGAGLQAEHEKYIAQYVGSGMPVFVTNYPRDIKAFYMRQTPTPDAQPGAELNRHASPTVDCFDLLVPELCEIAGGSMREHRLPDLLEAMRTHGIAVPESNGAEQDGAAESSGAGRSSGRLDWYVDLRRWGCPPHGGFGLGFDRLLCYLSGVHSVRDVVAFPRWHGRCDC